jgi:hypothetical protein
VHTADIKARAYAVGWTAIAIGLATAITPTWATTTPAGAGFTLGLGAMTVIFGMWSLIARDPTRDHWALTVVGLVLEMAPWVGGFAGDGAAWVAWTTGLLLMVLAGAAYINDEAANVAETVRVKKLATYLAQHPQSPPSSECSPQFLASNAGQSDRAGSVVMDSEPY